MMTAMMNPASNPGWRVGVDTGGTFTDLLLIDPSGAVRESCKVLSTPDDPGRAVQAGIDRLLERFNQRAPVAGGSGRAAAGRARRLTRADLAQVVHGSTVATNALLERKTDRAALITTAGFEDLLALARQDRPELYALSPHRPDPPIPRDRVLGVNERLGYDGSVLTALTEAEIDRVIEALTRMEVSAVAVCLLHSYANDAHERMLAEAIRAAFAKLPGAGVHLTVSSELLPELREYERASTCAVNAGVGPTMSRYIGGLDEALGPGRLRVMASGGGTLPPAVVAQRPVETVVSGPAGGVIGAWAMAKAAGETRIIGFDMGGTSTDVSLCDAGPTRTTETTISGMPIKLPMIDIHTVGAGGGSLAWIDDGGALRVGPASAGADPGPACYGRQGDDPALATVTDAHAVLGHLRADRPLGEAMALDRGAACAAVGKLADRLGLSIEQAAEGVLRVADAAMARAVQRVSVQRGRDARGYVLTAFGGAGGLHACRLAEVLGMTRVLVPVHGGLLSAFGMLAAPIRYDASHAVLARFEHDGHTYPDPAQHPGIIEALDTLKRQGNEALAGDGVAPADRALRPALDLRFEGQSYELTVAMPGALADEADGGGLSVVGRFLAEHDRRYGYAPVGRAIEVVAARLASLGPEPVLSPGAADEPVTPGGSAGELSVYERGEARAWQRVDRAALAAGQVLPGPAVVEEYAATTLVLRGWSAEVLGDGQLMITREGAPSDG